MRTLAIVNPVAGQGRGVAVWRQLRTQLRDILQWDCVTTERAAHARELAEAARLAEYERVVVIGGDGTVCEAANGLAHGQTSLAIIPVGRGNDTARNLGVPGNHVAAARLAAVGTAHVLDLGVVRTSQETTTYFMNIAGVGFDAEVSRRVDRWRMPVRGTLPYLLGALRTLWSYDSPRLRICVDQQIVDERVFLVAIANGPTYGGGMRIAPHARPDDGVLDVCVVRALARVDLLRMIPSVYAGRHVGHPAVRLFRCREVSVEADQAVSCHVDGDSAADLPLYFGSAPGAIRCVTGSAAWASSSTQTITPERSTRSHRAPRDRR